MEQKRSSLGVGNLVIAIYAIFALSATVRAAYQLLRKFQDAPVAYSLSLISGVIYLVATVALIRKDFRLARITLVLELIGVLIVGSLSLLAPDLFAHPSVWSQFGSGYGFIPLVLPIFGLWWLRRVSK
mgnify:CR=1 FL=1